MPEAVPSQIRVSKDRRELTLKFADGAEHVLPAEMLRVLSPSAEVQGHSPDQRVTVGGKRNVGVIGIEPVGNYAIRISFDDLHSTGIYTWSYLDRLWREKDALWAAYLAELEEKGMSR